VLDLVTDEENVSAAHMIDEVPAKVVPLKKSKEEAHQDKQRLTATPSSLVAREGKKRI